MAKADPLFTFFSFLKYKFRAKGKHGIHSPFVYRLYEEVVKGSESWTENSIEGIRDSLKKNPSTLEITDFKNNTTNIRSVAKIANTTLSSRRFSAFLHFLATHLNTKEILETGTSLGINTAYLALDPKRKVTTIEGNKSLVDVAGRNFEKLGLRNISLQHTELKSSFSKILEGSEFQMIFLDAEHSGRTLEFCLNEIDKYLDEIKVIIIHDIYWSRDMFSHWNKIMNQERYPLTIDIFDAGLLFPDIDIEKQHFTLKF